MRFPEFSGEWEKYVLTEFVERVTRRNKGNECKLPLTISAQYGLVDQITFFNKIIASDDMSNYYLLTNGDFAYNKSYSSEYPWGAIKRLDRYEYGALSSLYICFRPLNHVSSDFLTHYFETKKWHQGISEIAVEGARNHGLLNIGIQDFFATKHYLPQSILEQEKIACFLNLIEERIRLQNKIIEDLKKLKSAVITVIFTTTNGVNYQLKDLAKFIGGGTPSSNDSSYWSGDIPWISSSDVSEDNINKITITRHITNEAIKKSATQICESPCILIVSRVGVGKVALSNISLCTSQDFCNLTKIKCNPKFLAYQLQSIMKRKSYAVQGTSIKGITTEEIKKTGIMLPSIEKQLSIASTLSRIDTFIDVEISILENYQKLRKYLLQQMFI